MTASTNARAEPPRASSRGRSTAKGPATERDVHSAKPRRSPLEARERAPASVKADNRSAPVTIALGEFADLTRRGLLQILAQDHPNLQIIGIDLNIDDLINVIAAESPHVVALTGAAVAGTSTLSRLNSVQPATAAFVLAHEPTNAYGMMALAAGATCVALSASAGDILTAIHLTAKGGGMFVPSAGTRIDHRLLQAPLLTAREIDVLERLSRDEPYEHIAYSLKIGVETARSHGANIRAKLGAAHKHELVGVPIPPRSTCEV